MIVAPRTLRPNRAIKRTGKPLRGLRRPASSASSCPVTHMPSLKSSSSRSAPARVRCQRQRRRRSARRWRVLVLSRGKSMKVKRRSWPTSSARGQLARPHCRMQYTSRSFARPNAEPQMPTPNPSINRTSTSRLRRLAAAGYVKR